MSDDERPLSLLRTRWDRGLLVMVVCSLVLHALVLVVIFTFVSRTRERDPGLMTAYTVDITDLPPLPRLGENRTPGAPDVALKGGERRRSEPAKPPAGASLPAPVKVPEPPPAVVTAPAEAKPAPAEKQEVAAQAPPPQEQAQEPIQPPQEKAPPAQNEVRAPEPETKTEAAPEPEKPKQDAPAEPVPALAKAEPAQPQAEPPKPPAPPQKAQPQPSAPAAEKASPAKTPEPPADGEKAKAAAAKSENGHPKKVSPQAQGTAPKPAAEPRPRAEQTASAPPTAPAAAAAELPKSPEPTGDDRYAAAIERVRQRTGGGGGGLGGAGDPTRPPSIGGAGIGSGNQVVGAEFLIYYNIIISRIKQSWVWVGHNDNLAVTVRFVITPDGEIRDVQLDRSSGDGAYDESVLRAVREANPLPPPPATHRRDFSEVELTFRPGDFREAG